LVCVPRHDIAPQLRLLDMNDPWNLNSYSQLLLFQNNLSMDSISFNSPTKSQQQALQLLAHGLGLEYEYYLSIRRALILRPIIWGENSDYSAGINPMDLVQNYGQPSELIDSNDYLAQQSVPLAQPNDVRLPLRPSMSELGEHTYWQLPQTSPTFQLNQPSFPPSQSTADMEEYVGSNSQNSNPSHLHSQQQASFHVDDSRQARETGTCPGTGPLPAYDPDLGPRTTPEQAQHIRASNIASPTLPVAQTILPQQARPSRSASVHSVQSVQGRNRIEKAASRKSSIRSAGSSMFSCFDSRSDRSLASHVSNASRRSKRSLDKFARAAVKAVKAIGACWRCKFLRKSVSIQSRVQLSAPNTS
jgi:hypothetical protein